MFPPVAVQRSNFVRSDKNVIVDSAAAITRCQPSRIKALVRDQAFQGKQYDTSRNPASRSPQASALVQNSLCPGADRDRARGARRLFLSGSRQGAEAARRRL